MYHSFHTGQLSLLNGYDGHSDHFWALQDYEEKVHEAMHEEDQLPEG
jgi:hypothetical protein